jgi:hypothetical protein
MKKQWQEVLPGHSKCQKGFGKLKGIKYTTDGLNQNYV